MKRNFMKRYLGETEKKSARAEEQPTQENAAEASQEASEERQAKDPDKKKGERTERESAKSGDNDIFDDTDVCRVLGLRRRVLVRARTERARGEAWDAKGTHAGMTRKWIEAKKHGATEGIKPIEGSDGIVTVRFVRRVANAKLAGVRLIASGRERVAWVHDANAMCLGEEFDCRWIGKQLHYIDALNRESY